MQELSTNEKGTRAEGAVLSALLRCGYNVLIPTYVGEVDFFGVYSPDLERVYLVPIEAVASYKREMWLRLEASRNGQVNGTNLAAKFLLVPSEAA
jgi:PD-(D/E)XK endonuclease